MAGLFLCWSLCAGAPARALDLQLDETRPGLRLSVAEDFVHAVGSVVVSGRYGGAWGVRAGFWARDSDAEGDAPTKFAGVDYMWTYGNWHAELGTVWIDKTNGLNGTHWDFDVALAYDLSDRIFVEYRHYSHGKKLGIKRDAANSGWNLIGVGFVF
jgi:hypothetical protein